jgi:hypothetical protein
MSAVVLASLVLAAAAGAGPLRNVYDDSATPSWWTQVNGSGASADAATSVLADGGGAYVAGWAGNAAGNFDATLARFTAAGTQKWLKRYDGPAHKADAVWKLAKGPSGTVYGAGWSQAGNGKNDILVVKWSSSGDRLWAKRYDGAQHGADAAVAVGVDKYGDVTVAGSSEGAHGTDFVVVKWSKSGVRRWAWRYDGSGHLNDAATDIRMESGGTTYVTGRVKLAGPQDAALTVKFSRPGVKLWSRVYRGTSSLGADATSIAARPAGGVYVGGWTMSAVTAKDGLVLRYNSAGTGVALPPAVAAGDQVFADFAVTTNRRIVAVGSSTAGGNGDLFAGVWANETSAPSFGATGGAFDDGLTAITADAFGGYYMTGYNRTAPNLSQITTYRRSLVTGGGGFNSVWGPALGLDVPAAVAVSGTTAYVVGLHYMGPAEGWNQVVLTYIY